MVSIDQNLFVKEQLHDQATTTVLPIKKSQQNITWLPFCKNLAVATGVLTTFGASYCLYQSYKPDFSKKISSDIDVLSNLNILVQLAIFFITMYKAYPILYDMRMNPGPFSSIDYEFNGNAMRRETGYSRDSCFGSAERWERVSHL